MKKFKFLLVALFFSFITSAMQAQTVYDYKVKDKINEKERTKILDCVRNTLYKEFKETYVFEVNKLNVSGNYAWFMGNAQRKDGKEIKIKQSGDYDCCHVEGLFQKVKGVWYVVAYGAFTTDVWYEGICEKHKAPCEIYN